VQPERVVTGARSGLVPQLLFERERDARVGIARSRGVEAGRALELRGLDAA
jgi:hypothetical protein